MSLTIKGQRAEAQQEIRKFVVSQLRRVADDIEVGVENNTNFQVSAGDTYVNLSVQVFDRTLDPRLGTPIRG
jgi:hypothetical protein